MFIISLKMIEALKIPENNDSRAPCLDTLSSRRRSKSGIQPAQAAKCLPSEAMHKKHESHRRMQIIIYYDLYEIWIE